MPKSKLTWIFKQYRIPFLGEIVDSIFTAMPALSAVSLISTMIILYEVTKKYFIDWAPWLNIFYFMGVLIMLFIPFLLLVYKFIILSVWHFRSTQMGHLEKKVDDTSNELAIVSSELKELSIQLQETNRLLGEWYENRDN